MPIPNPHRTEKKDEFISRCIREMKDLEDKDRFTDKQIQAICFKSWEDRNKKKNELLSNKSMI